MSVKTEIDLLVTSDETQGALDVAEGGGEFAVRLSSSIDIPDDARNVKLQASKVLIWNNFMNIKTGINDKIQIYGPDKDGIDRMFDITIQAGSYNLSTLSNDILAELSVKRAKVEPTPLLSFQADIATGRVEITYNYSSVYIETRGWNTFHVILGLNKDIYRVPEGVSLPYSFLAPNLANFASLQYILVHSDITNEGLPINGIYNQTICQLLPDAPSGSLIVFSPVNPLKIDCNNLIGSKLEQFKIWITDEKNQLLSTSGETFSVLLKLSYERNLVYGE